ncbi:MAG: redoxin domain-containing protein, partial [Deltaproteobacteria bacterium]|nr:redoxin domain-containing protein [Deltaproteobacteria bacterium]
MELEALQQAAGSITDLGATLVAVSPQIETFNREFIQKHRLTFDILSDPGNEVAKTFGLVHELPDDLRKVYRSFGIDLEKSNADGLW